MSIGTLNDTTVLLWSANGQSDGWTVYYYLLDRSPSPTTKTNEPLIERGIISCGRVCEFVSGDEKCFKIYWVSLLLVNRPYLKTILILSFYICITNLYYVFIRAHCSEWTMIETRGIATCINYIFIFLLKVLFCCITIIILSLSYVIFYKEIQFSIRFVKNVLSIIIYYL